MYPLEDFFVDDTEEYALDLDCFFWCMVNQFAIYLEQNYHGRLDVVEIHMENEGEREALLKIWYMCHCAICGELYEMDFVGCPATEPYTYKGLQTIKYKMHVCREVPTDWSLAQTCVYGITA